MKRKRIKLTKIGIVIFSAFVFLCVAGFAVYANNYYHASDEALACTKTTDQVEVSTDNNQELAFIPKQQSPVTTGLIFYPGGKVEYKAYAPLMSKLAERGILCVLLKVKCNLAIIDQDAANGIQEQYPEIQNWYIGGHSLGGVVAGMYVKKHASDYKGLLLLGAYSSADLSQTELSVLSIYGENDGVMNRKNYKKYKSNLPGDFTEYIIPGGCHSYFGSYGIQKGDGRADITPEEQQDITADQIADWIK